jgi:hypothetical protein
MSDPPEGAGGPTRNRHTKEPAQQPYLIYRLAASRLRASLSDLSSQSDLCHEDQKPDRKQSYKSTVRCRIPGNATS